MYPQTCTQVVQVCNDTSWVHTTMQAHTSLYVAGSCGSFVSSFTCLCSVLARAHLIDYALQTWLHPFSVHVLWPDLLNTEGRDLHTRVLQA